MTPAAMADPHFQAASLVAFAVGRESGRSEQHFTLLALGSLGWALPANLFSVIRCIIGNPFRPVSADPKWLTSVVVGLAQAIYEERAFDRMPILADALEVAGCEDADVLAHCRGGRG